LRHYKIHADCHRYAVDSLVLLLQSVIAGQAALEFQPSYPRALTIAVYVGMLTGAIFWGFGADIIGRRFAFNVSLFICSIAGIVSGAAPSWPSLAFFIAMVGFGGGGNLILDTAVFLEYLPSYKQWALTWLAAWWGIGQTITGLWAWLYLSMRILPRTKCDANTQVANSDWNCTSAATCTYDNNKGWRYVMYTASAMVFVMSCLRVTIIRLKETPKYLLGMGKEEELVRDFHALAAKYNRPCSITVEQLQACGVIASAHGKSKWSVSEFMVHIRGLFATKTIGLSTCLIWLSWTLIGLAYPLFYVFLSSYLATRGAQLGETSVYETWRNYALVNVASVSVPGIAQCRKC
jgi:MFS family permease